MSYESVVLEDSPKQYLRLGEPSGTEAADASGNSLPGTYKGTPTLGAASLLPSDSNTAVTLGKAQYIERAHNALLNVGDTFTFEAWIKLNSVGGGAEHCICFKQGTAGTTPKFVVNSEGKLLLRVPGFTNIVVGSSTLSTATTYHVVAVKSGTTRKAYLNAADDTGTVAERTCTNNTGALRWGSEGGEAEENFDGVLDECAYYSTALSAARVEAHYKAGVETGLASRLLLLGVGR